MTQQHVWGTRWTAVFLLVTAVLITACQEPPVLADIPAPTATTAPVQNNASLDGLWQMDGYGYLYEIEDNRFQIYTLTDISCVPSLSGEVLIDAPSPDGSQEIDAYLQIHFLNDTGVADMGVQVLPGDSAEEKRFLIDGVASHMNAHRLNEWPAMCQTAVPNTPQATFDVFWQAYAEHYPFFALKGIDWQTMYDTYRPQVTDSTTDSELLAIMQEMIQPLTDAHTWVQAVNMAEDGFAGDFVGRRPDANRLSQSDRARTLEIIETGYLQTPLQWAAHNKVAFGLLAGNVGYLRIDGFNNFIDSNEFWPGLAILDAALDDIFSQTTSLNGLVIDIRANDGGADLYGLAVASRLTASPYHAYTIQARNNPSDPAQWTVGQPIMVQPSSRPSYHGPVILLTSRDTESAAETFTMALMNREPGVVRIGENTQGVFSVVLVHILPNGWWMGLQNERFLTATGETYDGPGIPPTIPTAVFTPNEMDAGIDSALDKALETLLVSAQN